jgi:hypothetical protein
MQPSMTVGFMPLMSHVRVCLLTRCSSAKQDHQLAGSVGAFRQLFVSAVRAHVYDMAEHDPRSMLMPTSSIQSS